jgi:RHH-type proline utilization regulon transcriptional repressor/proline dehydrogenase/delta 1-pyrroline-5-carboxylate dehydrogenase
VDVGPVIDAEARDGIERHIATMRSRGRRVYRQGREHAHDTRQGTFVMPTLIELDNIAELQREVFGPVLHLVRYRRRDLGALVGQINGTGYGLTLGVHTRIDETIAQIVAHAKAGNVYVNRNIVGAVVGVQPFGGEGLSGTGPKAGGPLYMVRMLSKRPDDVLVRAISDAADADPAEAPVSNAGLSALGRWAAETGRHALLAAQCKRFGDLSRSGFSRTLAGPTGERNVYTLQPREAVLCLAGAEEDRLVQLAAVLSVGSTAIWPADAGAQSLRSSLPVDVQQLVAIASDWTSDTVVFDAVLHHGDAGSLASVIQRIASRPGPIVGVRAFAPGGVDIPLESLVVERALSINTAAAGGNASLMSIG